MLQQTRVETVIPYFQRFLKLFPTLPALARASLQSVLKAWAGLGYYARARNFHKAARIICHDFGGKIPSTKNELLKLPGFGPYTAGAVASLAFNQPAAALDGNVKRVLSRLYCQEASTARQTDPGEKFAEDLIPPRRACDFNQALMDLGALICHPVRPRCPDCPLKKFCVGRATDLGAPSQPSPLEGEGEGGGFGDQNKKQKIKKFRKEIWVIALIEQEGKFLIHRNEERRLLADLWQFPFTVLRASELNRDKGGDKGDYDERKALKKAMRQKFGLKIKIKDSLPVKEYFFTHIHARMKPFLCSSPKSIPGGLNKKDVRWIKLSNFSRYPVSTAMRKIAALISSPSPGRH